VGIGLVFVLISIFEMARGMWVYHSLAHVAKETARYLVVHGQECQNDVTCRNEAVLSAVAAKITAEGGGLIPTLLEVKVYVKGETVGTGGTQVVGSSDNYVLVSSLAGNTAAWYTFAKPPNSVVVSFRYPFRSAIAMLWPGSAQKVQFGEFLLGASSWDTMEF
jgi:hypothetical protein